jgi:hypothetical protein
MMTPRIEIRRLEFKSRPSAGDENHRRIFCAFAELGLEITSGVVVSATTGGG